MPTEGLSEENRKLVEREAGRILSPNALAHLIRTYPASLGRIIDAARAEGPAPPGGGGEEALAGALRQAIGALREAEAILGGEYGDSYGSLVRDMMNLEVAAELALGAVGELPFRQWPRDMDQVLLAVVDTARRQGALQYERAIARAYQLGERAALTQPETPDHG